MNTTRPGRHGWTPRRRGAALAALLSIAACGTADRPAEADDADTKDTRDSVAAPTADTTGTDAPAVAPDDTIAPLTSNGWGPLRIGMSRAQVVAAAGEDAHPERVGGPEPDVCDEFRPTRAPEHMLLMVQRDTLTRITIGRDSEVRTERGFGVGDSAAAILAAYGPAAESTPHKYRDAPSAYITVWDTAPGGSAPERGIVYDIGNDGRVSLVHAGGESITYVEGCL